MVCLEGEYLSPNSHQIVHIRELGEDTGDFAREEVPRGNRGGEIPPPRFAKYIFEKSPRRAYFASFAQASFLKALVLWIGGGCLPQIPAFWWYVLVVESTEKPLSSTN